MTSMFTRYEPSGSLRQLQVSSKTKDIAELKEMLYVGLNESLTQGTKAVKEFLKRPNAYVVAKGGH